MRWWQALGPGLLWAGTAIGVSHLVQSTRAGAGFSLTLLWLVLLANAMKYPAFEAGPRYAAATKTSLLEGYRRRGRWALVLFFVLTIATMFTVIAGVTIVTAGMASVLITDALSTAAWSGVLLVFTLALLRVGQFRLLEGFMKAMMLLLTVSTVLCVALLLPQLDASKIQFFPLIPADLNPKTLLFICALIGWMPSAIDTAVWQSLWGLEKERVEGIAFTPARASLDFNIGYIGTALLAGMFVFLGAGVLFGAGHELPASSGGFATMLVDVYASVLGSWARPLILVAAFSTMLSTTVAVTDGFPRALDAAWQRWQGPEQGHIGTTRVYWGALVVSALVAWLIIVQFTGQLGPLVDLATTLTGVTAPVLAVLNLVTLRGAEVPEEARPTGAYLAYHLVGIAFLLGMAGLFLYARFVL